MQLIIGGPGTGKTTSLIQTIQRLRPDNFALLSFTRQAANEAKSKLKGYTVKDLEWVRTIHSLAFKCLKLTKGQVFSHDHLMKFGKEYGFEFYGKFKNDEDGTMEGLTEDDKIFRLMQIHRLNEFKVADDLFKYDIERIMYMKTRYGQFKRQKGLIDFTDMLELVLKVDLPHFDLLCVDETQDLTPLQFQIIDKLKTNSKTIVYCGDDDQMIYEWAGVKREYFMKVFKESTVKMFLTINYRVPGEIIGRSNYIISHCKQRIDKPKIVISAEGINCIKRIDDIDQVKFDPNKTYLILVRNSYLLNSVKFILEELGLNYCYLSDRGTSKSKIFISTIHGSKGAEADVVILLPDVSPATYEQITSDAEHRVWYVAVTRAKKELLIVDPKEACYYDL